MNTLKPPKEVPQDNAADHEKEHDQKVASYDL